MIVVHFGLRKAGSSSIQRFLRVNQVKLRSFGYDYIPIGHRNGQSHLNIAYEVRSQEKFEPEYGGLGDVRKYWLENTGKVLIISSEIMEETPPAGIRRFEKKLSRLGDSFLPLMVIRDMSSLVVSAYSENTKMGRMGKDFDKYIVDFLRRPRADFYTLAEKWADVFGWDRVRVRVLDREFLLNGDLIDDFINTAGLEMSPEEIAQLKRPPESNVSPGWRVVEALRALYDGRHGLPETHPLLRKRQNAGEHASIVKARAQELGDAYGWNSDKGLYLTTEQAQACLDAYLRSIDALNTRLTSPLPQPKTLNEKGFVPREFVPDVSRIPANDRRRFYDELGEIPFDQL